ncbi:MAG: hypothetical protein AB7L71_19655 [Vicinamibacterales bacterium]
MSGAAGLVLVIGLVLGTEQTPGRAPDAGNVLARARMAYNAQRFDEAARLAADAAAVPALVPSAALIRSRALLEQYRRGGDVADVALARQSLLLADPERLSPRERAERRLATAELLFVDEQYGAAAEAFALSLSETTDTAARTRVLDWWAASLDRYAQVAPDGERQRRYARLLAGLDAEPAGAVTQYWRAAAYRGVEDLDRAWAVAVAAWIQAPDLASGVAAVASLRADIDRLMRDAIIPERARRAPAPADPDAVRVALTAEWDAIRERWEKHP